MTTSRRSLSFPAAMLYALNPLRWLEARLPHSSVDHRSPLFRYEMRGAPTLLQLRQRSLRRLGLVVGMSLAAWGLWVLLMFMDMRRAADLHAGFGGLLGMYFAFTFADKLLLDFMGVSTMMSSIREDMAQGRWDLLRLSNIPAEKLVRIRQAVGQVRAWPTLMTVVGARLSAVLLFGLHYGVLPQVTTFYGRVENLLDVMVWDDPRAVIAFTALVIVTFMAAYIYVVEPFWRLRTVTAASVAVATQKRDRTMALIFGLGALVGIWLAQIVLSIFAALALIYMGTMSLAGEGLFAFFGFVYMGALGVSIHGMYSALTEMWIGRAVQRLSR
ncbi:MAG: hypothetical protein OHK0046_36310 [Anaerolineae bacterium]